MGWKHFAMIHLPQAFPYGSPLLCNSALLDLCSPLHFFCYRYFPHYQSQISFPFPPANNGVASSCEKREIYSFNSLSADVSNDRFFLFSFFYMYFISFQVYSVLKLLKTYLTPESPLLLCLCRIDILICIIEHLLNGKPCSLHYHLVCT